MNGGYINEGGQLKSKNGQKYVINSGQSGVYVPRYCIILTVLLGVLAMIVIAVLSYLLLAQASSSAAVTGADWRNATSNNASDQLALSGLYVGGGGEAADRQQLASIEQTTTDAVNLNTAGSTDVSSTTESTTTTTTVDVALASIVSAEGWSPVLYQLLIEPDFEASLSHGSVNISVIEDEPIAAPGTLPLPIVLDINNITVLSASVTINTGATIDRQLSISAEYGRKNDTYVLRILEPLPLAQSQDSFINVHLDFISRLSDTLTGFYKTTYRTNGIEQVMASTQFSPVDARRAFPCFDRPGKKARFEISLVRHKNFTMARSNMPSIRTSHPRPDYIRDDFNVTPRMSTYLVAFVVSNLVNTTVTDSIEAPDLPTIRMWTRPQHQHQTQFMYTMTQRMLSVLDRYFGIPFGLPKIDLVAVPDFGFSAMENYGLITFRESGLIVDPDEENRSVFHMLSVCKTLGHEIAHQWFGNLVTMRWWNDLWLKEGFATYMSYVTLQDVEPGWHAMDYFSHNELQKAMQADSDESAHAISFPVNSSADIRRMFDPISYSKGATIVRMLNGILGERTFRAGLKSYLQTYRFANAEQDDLWRIMTEAAHRIGSLPRSMDVKTIMDTWTLQSGYPVLMLSRNDTARTIQFTQTRYMLPNANASAEPSTWYVPITMESAGARTRDTRPSHWLRPDAGRDGLTVHNVSMLETDWTYVNIQRIGYYRVNYDHESWLRLSQNFYDLPAVAQGALLDDSLALARAGHLKYDVPLWLLMKLARNSEADGAMGAQQWAAAEDGVQFLADMLSREPANGDWRALMKFVLQPMFVQIGFQEVPDDSHVMKAHRVRVISSACYFGVERCVSRAVHLFRQWMDNVERVRLSPDLQSTILCTALMQGGPKEWQFVYERYVNHSTASEKEVYLNALGCTAKPWLLSKYLHMILSPTAGIRKQDATRAFAAIARNPVGNELAFDFLSTSIESFSNYFGEGFSIISKMIGFTKTFANLPVQLTKYEAFADKAQQLGLSSIETSIRLLLPEVRNNVYWRQNRYEELEKYLRSLVQAVHAA